MSRAVANLFLATALLGWTALALARTVPSGTPIEVRSSETIDSQTARVGQTFPATVAKDVTDSTGAVVIRRGAPARLVIRQVSTGGEVGTRELAIDLASLTVNGQRHTVSTPEAIQKS